MIRLLSLSAIITKKTNNGDTSSYSKVIVALVEVLVVAEEVIAVAVATVGNIV